MAPPVESVMVARACSPARLRKESFFTARITIVYRRISAWSAAWRASSNLHRLVVSPASVTSTTTRRRPAGLRSSSPDPRQTASYSEVPAPGERRFNPTSSVSMREVKGVSRATSSETE